MATRVKYRAARLVGESLVQGMLYDCILFNIDDKDVKKLAHPGLALRYLTADIIDRALAGPCKLELPPPGPAREAEVQRLFEALQRYASLVVPDGPGLRHRADVRRAMLASLDHDKPALVREIDRGAVRYHQENEQANPRVARAEKIYHRLRRTRGAPRLTGGGCRGSASCWRIPSGPVRPRRSSIWSIVASARSWGVSKLSLGDPEWEQFTAAKVVDRALRPHGRGRKGARRASRALTGRSALSGRSPAGGRAARLATSAGLRRGRPAGRDATNDPRRLETALLLSVGAATKQLDAADAARIAERAEEVVRTNSTPPPGLGDLEKVWIECRWRGPRRFGGPA